MILKIARARGTAPTSPAMLTAAPKLVPVNRVPSSNRRVASRGAGPPLVTFRHMLAHCCSCYLKDGRFL